MFASSIGLIVSSTSTAGMFWFSHRDSNSFGKISGIRFLVLCISAIRELASVVTKLKVCMARLSLGLPKALQYQQQRKQLDFLNE